MKRYMWGIVLIGITATGLMTGCTAYEACGAECANREPNETGCDKNASDLATSPVAGSSGFEGTIAIRMADPKICEGLYWARFAPSEQITMAFEVTLKINGEVVSVPGQKSDPQTPALYAWTKAYQASSGDTLEACVTAEDQQEICVDETLP